jgi:hypothetical protein
MSGELDKWRPFRQQIAFGCAVIGIGGAISLLVVERTIGTALASTLLLLGAAASLASFGPYDLRQKYILMWAGVTLWLLGMFSAYLQR